MKLSAAVIIYNQDSFLFLKRIMPPLIWAPPSGGVLDNETVYAAAVRETKEETGLFVSDLLPVEVWTGDNAGEAATSITFIAKTSESLIQLSHEHDECKWVRFDQLDKFASKTTFSLKSWIKYVELYECYVKIFNDSAVL